ncbi:unnamed protein product [Fusarium graminearum]
MRLCLLLSFSTTSILTVVDLRSRLRLMVKSGLHMTTHLLQVPHSALTYVRTYCLPHGIRQHCTALLQLSLPLLLPLVIFGSILHSVGR